MSQDDVVASMASEPFEADWLCPGPRPGPRGTATTAVAGTVINVRKVPSKIKHFSKDINIFFRQHVSGMTDVPASERYTSLIITPLTTSNEP